MSKEREINTPSGFTKVLTQDDLLKLDDKQLDAHVASVLDRGLTNVRLKVPLPDDLIGEWVPDDPQSVYEKQLLGFVIDEKYALKNSLHSDGSNKSKIGDCVHMVLPRRIMDSIERKRRADYDAKHRPKSKSRQIEEQGFLSQDHGGLAIEEKSTVDEVGLNSIVAAKDAANREKVNDNVVTT